jgi:hypothetical protein
MDPDQDPTPDPTPFFSDFKDAKDYFFPIFFYYNLPTGTLSSVLKFIFWLKFCVKILFCKHYFRKGKGSDLDPGGPKTCGSGSPTLLCCCKNIRHLTKRESNSKNYKKNALIALAETKDIYHVCF